MFGLYRDYMGLYRGYMGALQGLYKYMGAWKLFHGGIRTFLHDS